MKKERRKGKESSNSRSMIRKVSAIKMRVACRKTRKRLNKGRKR
jgi:hypothetical protein